MTPEETLDLGAKALAAGNQKKALLAFDAVLSQNPGHAGAHINRAQIRLARGDFEGGFDDYDFRFTKPGVAGLLARPKCPRWQGGDLTGKALHIWTEQGLGDQILSLGPLRELLPSLGRCVLECEPRLVPLLKRSFPTVTVVPMTGKGDPAIYDPDLDLHCPAYDLIRYDWPRIEAISANTPYLSADPEAVSVLKNRYGTSKPLIGISWRSPKSKRGDAKTIPLKDWAPIFQRRDIQLVSLQYGLDPSEQSELLAAGVMVDPVLNTEHDIDGFAAQVAAMDGVITASNTTAHFAGALAIPTLTLLPKRGAGLIWYWFEDRDDSPWYPSMTLARAPATKWTPVFRKAVSWTDALLGQK